MDRTLPPGGEEHCWLAGTLTVTALTTTYASLLVLFYDFIRRFSIAVKISKFSSLISEKLNNKSVNNKNPGTCLSAGIAVVKSRLNSDRTCLAPAKTRKVPKKDFLRVIKIRNYLRIAGMKVRSLRFGGTASSSMEK